VQSARKGIIQFRLSSVTQQMSRAKADVLALGALRRILSADSQYCHVDSVAFHSTVLS